MGLGWGAGVGGTVVLWICGTVVLWFCGVTNDDTILIGLMWQARLLPTKRKLIGDWWCLAWLQTSQYLQQQPITTSFSHQDNQYRLETTDHTTNWKIINKKVGTTCWLTQSPQCWRILKWDLFQRYRLQAENMAYHPQSINRRLFTPPYRQLVRG